MITIFIIISIIPLLQWIYYSKIAKNQVVINYIFEQQLFEIDLNTSKDIRYTEATQKLLFNNRDFEQKKQEEYSITLP